jgi:hypothetical protein
LICGEPFGVAAVCDDAVRVTGALPTAGIDGVGIDMEDAAI